MGFEVGQKMGFSGRQQPRLRKIGCLWIVGEEPVSGMCGMPWSCTPGRKLLCNQTGLLAEPFERGSFRRNRKEQE